LEEEDREINLKLRKGRPTTGAEAVKAQRVSSMSTSLANDYLALIIDAAFPRGGACGDVSSSAASVAAAAEQVQLPHHGGLMGGNAAEGMAALQALRVREEAISLLKVIMRRGLTSPSRVAPSLIALRYEK